MLEQRRTFVLRVWYECSVGDTEAPVLRGSLECVDKGAIRYFGKLSDLAILVDEVLGDLANNTAEDV
jgi:hypothetical protein